VNGHLHAPVSLPQWKELLVIIEQNLGEPRGWCGRFKKKEKSLAPAQNVNTIPPSAHGNKILQMVVFFNQTFRNRIT
jgi:hypothetical protein